jgi:hypothetical protein
MYVVTPPCKHWIRFNTMMPDILKELKKGFPHSVFERFTSLFKAIDKRSPDEGVFIFSGVPTGLARFVASPEPKSGDPALFTNKAIRMEHRQINGW